MDELTKAFPNVPELWEGAADGAWRHEGKRPKRPCRGGHHLRRVPICRRNAPRQKIAGGIARNQTAASELTFVAPRGPFMRSIFQAARPPPGGFLMTIRRPHQWQGQPRPHAPPRTKSRGPLSFS
jgi:hypothetical protein